MSGKISVYKLVPRWSRSYFTELLTCICVHTDTSLLHSFVGTRWKLQYVCEVSQGKESLQIGKTAYCTLTQLLSALPKLQRPSSTPEEERVLFYLCKDSWGLILSHWNRLITIFQWLKLYLLYEGVFFCG